MKSHMMQCPYCMGHGSMADHRTCLSCKGKGVVAKLQEWGYPINCYICNREFEHGDTYVLVDKKKKLGACHKCYLAQQHTTKGVGHE